MQVAAATTPLLTLLFLNFWGTRSFYSISMATQSPCFYETHVHTHKTVATTVFCKLSSFYWKPHSTYSKSKIKIRSKHLTNGMMHFDYLFLHINSSPAIITNVVVNDKISNFTLTLFQAISAIYLSLISICWIQCFLAFLFFLQCGIYITGSKPQKTIQNPYNEQGKIKINTQFVCFLKSWRGNGTTHKGFIQLASLSWFFFHFRIFLVTFVLLNHQLCLMTHTLFCNEHYFPIFSYKNLHEIK